MSKGTEDYQLGSTHKIDTSGSIVDDEHVIQFDFEPGAVFKRLADDIYESPEAGVREPLTNSITSIRRVFDNTDEGVINIVVQDGEQIVMRLRDNGEGISKSVLKEVLTVIGRSKARDDGELSGQYGMGFLASYKLVGMDGGFLMCTNPRDSEEGPYTGLFKPGTFEPDKNNKFPQLLDEDDYGTVFEYYIRDSIDMSDLRDWVDKHARWSPVPVRYEELDEDGNIVEDEEYYASTIPEKYDSDPYLHVENEYYEAATSPSSENDTILISSPVSMGGSRTLRRKLPWNADLRLKYENGIVIDGPNKGLVPTTKDEYQDMSEERQEKYIPKDHLTTEDLLLPEPTGTREKVKKNNEFLRHVRDELMDKFIDTVHDTLDNFDPVNMSMANINNMKRHVLLRIFGSFKEDADEYTESKITTKLSNQFNYNNPSDDIVEFIQTMTKEVSVISEPKRYNGQYPRKQAYELEMDDESIFMCVSNNSWKADAVKNGNLETHLVKVERSSEYDPFKKHLGWNKLKEVDKSNAVDWLDISESYIEKLKSKNSGNNKETGERNVTIHYKSGGRMTSKRTVEQTVNLFTDDTHRRFGDVLVLFPRNGDYKISNHYNLADEGCSVATCGKKVREHLKDESDRIMTYSEYLNWGQNPTVRDEFGSIEFRKLLNDFSNIAVFVVSHIDSNILSEDKVLSTISDNIHPYVRGLSEVDNVCVVDQNDWKHFVNTFSPTDYDTDITVIRCDKTVNPKRTQEIDYEWCSLDKLYLEAQVSEDAQDTKEYQAIKSKHNGLSTELIKDAEMIKKLQNDSVLTDISEDTSTDIVLPKLRTKEGEMTIEEVYNNYNPDKVIIHSVSSDKMDPFMSKDMLENGHDYLNNSQTDYIDITIEDTELYIPVLSSNYKQISDHVEEETKKIGSVLRRDENSSKIDPQYIYGIKELDWSLEDIANLLHNYKFEHAVSLVDSIAESSTIEEYSDIN